MSPTRPDLDDLEDLSARLHDLAERWEVRPPDGRPDLASTRSRGPGWIPDWLRGGMVPILAGIVLVAVVVAASAWLSTLGTAPDPGPAEQAPTETQALGTGTVLDLLDQVPADVVGNAPVTITFGDVAAASDLAGIERPAVDDADAVATWLFAMSEGRAAGAGDEGPVLRLPMELNLTDVAGWNDELGWSLVDVDRFVDVTASSTPIGVAPDPDGLARGGRFTVVTGDAATVPMADGLADVDDGIARAGTPRTELADSTPARRLGGPLFLAERGARRVAASGRDMVDAWLGGGRRLATDPPMASVAVRIADGDPTTAVLARGSFAHDPADGAPFEEADLLTGPFDTVGVSWSRDDDGPRMTAVYHHDSPDDARRTAQEIPVLWATGTRVVTGRGPLDDLAEVESVETSGPDTVVVLRPRGGQEAQHVFSMLEFQDLPFRHAPGPTPTEPATVDPAEAATDDQGLEPGLEPGLEGWRRELREAGDPATVFTGEGPVGGRARRAAETLASLQWDSGRAIDGVFAVRCDGQGTFSVAHGHGVMAERLPCDGSTHRLDLVDATAPVGVNAGEAMVTTRVRVAVLTDDELGDTEFTTG